MSERLKLEYERNGDTIEVLARGTESDVRTALARLLGHHIPDAGKMVEALRDYDGDHEAKADKAPTAKNPDLAFGKSGWLKSWPKIELATPESIRASMARYGAKPWTHFPRYDPSCPGVVDSIIRELARLQQQLEALDHDGDHEAPEPKPEPEREVLGWLIVDRHDVAVVYYNGKSNDFCDVIECVRRWDHNDPKAAPHRVLQVWSDGKAEPVVVEDTGGEGS